MKYNQPETRERMMKTIYLNYALGLTLIVMCIVSQPVSASLSNLLEMSERAEQSDKQDLQGALDQANSCTRARNFSCSEEQLRKAAKLVNGSRDKRALNSAQQNLQAEKDRVAQEARDKAERERQIQLAEERAETDRRAEKRRRQREEAAENSAPSTNSASSQLQQSQRDLDALFSRTNRQLQENTDRAFQQQRERQQAAQRAAVDARAEENERIRRQNQRIAQQEQDRADEQARARREEQARQREQDRQQEQAPQQEQARQQGQARRKAEADAASLAEKKEPESKTIAVRGNSGLCFSRDIAESQARVTAKNSASDICDGTGGWKYPKLKFDGYIQCTACTGGEKGNFRCEVDQVTYTCLRY